MPVLQDLYTGSESLGSEAEERELAVAPSATGFSRFGRDSSGFGSRNSVFSYVALQGRDLLGKSDDVRFDTAIAV